MLMVGCLQPACSLPPPPLSVFNVCGVFGYVVVSAVVTFVLCCVVLCVWVGRGGEGRVVCVVMCVCVYECARLCVRMCEYADACA